MGTSLKLPVGIEDFQEIRRLGFYYVDKTQLIEQLLERWGKVNLFTRPRRFGKTLNMSMLRYFFEAGTDATLFDGLYISQNSQMCEAYMGKFPVIFLSLKGVEGLTFEQAEYRLVIPNREIREVYRLQIKEWFSGMVLGNTDQLTAFWTSLENGDTEAIERYLNRILGNSISVFDIKAPEAKKENAYHTLLVGLLAGNSDWLVKSNVEAGSGFADIIVETEDPDAGIIFELKCARERSGLDKACEKAMEQIRDRGYEQYLENDGRHNLLLYGIAFYKKRCKVVLEKHCLGPK